MSENGLSVIVPYLNEAETISEVVEEALAGLRENGFEGEVIVRRIWKRDPNRSRFRTETGWMKFLKGHQGRGGKDLATLDACYPVHVNTHRLAVVAERVPTVENDENLSEPSESQPFPWWIVVMSFVILAWGTTNILAFKKGAKGRHA